MEWNECEGREGKGATACMSFFAAALRLGFFFLLIVSPEWDNVLCLSCRKREEAGWGLIVSVD